MLKWQTTIPTREQIEAHGGRRGVWLVLNPVGHPLPTRGMEERDGWLWPRPKFATFEIHKDNTVTMYPNSGSSQNFPAEALGAASKGEGRGAWHFAPVVIDDADYTFQSADDDSNCLRTYEATGPAWTDSGGSLRMDVRLVTPDALGDQSGPASPPAAG